MQQTLSLKTKGPEKCLPNIQETVVSSVQKICFGTQPPRTPQTPPSLLCFLFQVIWGGSYLCPCFSSLCPESNPSPLCVCMLLLLFSVAFSSCVAFWPLVFTPQPWQGLCSFVCCWVYLGWQVPLAVGCRRSLLDEWICEYLPPMCCSTVSDLYFQVISLSRMTTGFPDIESVFRRQEDRIKWGRMYVRAGSVVQWNMQACVKPWVQIPTE